MLPLPDFRTDALTLSSVTLAKSADPPGSQLSKDDPFLFGPLRLIPRASNVLAPPDDLSFFYNVYNAKKDPASGKPSLDVSYSIEKKDGGAYRKLKTLPFPDQHEETQGYSILAEALSKWPGGDWRIAISVKDKIANAEASSVLEFALKR